MNGVRIGMVVILTHLGLILLVFLAGLGVLVVVVAGATMSGTVVCRIVVVIRQTSVTTTLGSVWFFPSNDSIL